MTGDAKKVTAAANPPAPLVSNTLIRATLAYAAFLGQDVAWLRERAELKDTDGSDPDGHISETYYDRLLFHSSVLAQDPFFGLRLGQQHSLRHMGVLGFLVMNSATFRDALRAYERFQTALGESMIMKVDELDTCCRITIHCHGGELSGRHRVEAFVSSLQAATWELTGKKLQYTRVTLVKDMPQNVNTYIEVLGIVPTLSSHNRVEFDASYLDLKIVHALPEMNYFFEKKIDDLLKAKQEGELPRRIKREIMRRLGSHLPITLQEFAKILALSTRSLQLKLQEAGTSFSTLHEDVQKEFAMGFLREGRPIAEISYALGFSEPSAFQRAFKRWTGESPAQFRNGPGFTG
ncbi:MAG TPA: AraC family transcriptional regulator ligand-binding domain-containing protein [Oligoflexus sp.]|uniref:AraC family transcriptional regulator n=1 Tax=Oligoflexus sp. TaxID=1971216 RepID=UPI002D47A107|nr:AraC family transcriptional regulator ligand-binding domain-containing protein [Oligoflexus sp.]HYX31927.1 AraC family transcriptional regulator ligand-binding domain-containing protein [Oligoflexus sp.]